MLIVWVVFFFFYLFPSNLSKIYKQCSLNISRAEKCLLLSIDEQEKNAPKNSQSVQLFSQITGWAYSPEVGPH